MSATFKIKHGTPVLVVERGLREQGFKPARQLSNVQTWFRGDEAWQFWIDEDTRTVRKPSARQRSTVSYWQA